MILIEQHPDVYYYYYYYDVNTFSIYSGENYTEFLLETPDSSEIACLENDHYIKIFSEKLRRESGIKNFSIKTKKYGSNGQEEFCYVLKLTDGADAAFFNLSFNEFIRHCKKSRLHLRGKKIRDRTFK